VLQLCSPNGRPSSGILSEISDPPLPKYRLPSGKRRTSDISDRISQEVATEGGLATD
ncbi:hypothetical protein AVEN_31115-1, partial [Araneus ventricosus]